MADGWFSCYSYQVTSILSWCNFKIQANSKIAVDYVLFMPMNKAWLIKSTLYVCGQSWLNATSWFCQKGWNHQPRTLHTHWYTSGDIIDHAIKEGGLWSMLKALWTFPSLNWSANLNPSFYCYQIKSPQRCWPDSCRLLSFTVSLTQGHYFFLWHFINLSDSVLILLRVLNWHWLSTSSNDICNVVHSNAANTVSNTIKPKIILTNAPNKCYAVGIFCNYVSDHCTVVCVRSCKLPETKPQFIFKIKIWLDGKLSFGVHIEGILKVYCMEEHGTHYNVTKFFSPNIWIKRFLARQHVIES